MMMTSDIIRSSSSTKRPREVQAAQPLWEDDFEVYVDPDPSEVDNASPGSLLSRGVCIYIYIYIYIIFYFYNYSRLQAYSA